MNISIKINGYFKPFLDTKKSIEFVIYKEVVILNNDKILQDALSQQNDFILKIFNDKRISDDVKEDYMKEYNQLYIKIANISK